MSDVVISDLPLAKLPKFFHCGRQRRSGRNGGFFMFVQEMSDVGDVGCDGVCFPNSKQPKFFIAVGTAGQTAMYFHICLSNA